MVKWLQRCCIFFALFYTFGTLLLILFIKLYFLFHFLPISLPSFLFLFGLLLHSFSFLLLSLSLLLNYLRFNLFLSLPILFYSLMHIIFSLDSLGIVLIPIIIISFEQTQRKIDIIDNMLYFCHDLLINRIFLPDPCLLLLLSLLLKIPDSKFFPLDPPHNPYNLRMQHTVDIIELLLLMVC